MSPTRLVQRFGPNGDGTCSEDDAKVGGDGVSFQAGATKAAGSQLTKSSTVQRFARNTTGAE
jgi:hypothetical protein